MVETSVAVATPSMTELRMTKGSASAAGRSAGSADLRFPARAGRGRVSARDRHHTTAQSATPSTAPGNRPPVNSAAIDIPVTEPRVMRMRLGGIVSVWAPVAASSAARSPRSAPRFSISGNSAGAIAAISAAFEPEIPETRYIAAMRT